MDPVIELGPAIAGALGQAPAGGIFPAGGSSSTQEQPLRILIRMQQQNEEPLRQQE